MKRNIKDKKGKQKKGKGKTTPYNCYYFRSSATAQVQIINTNYAMKQYLYV